MTTDTRRQTSEELSMDDRLESMYRRFTWRILSNYVTPWEFNQLQESVSDYEDWCATWCSYARGHL
jgi:hypothetical protein